MLNDTEKQATVTEKAVPRTGWWRTVLDSVRGIEHDYTEGPLGKAILLLAIPMVLEMAMESIFVVVDIVFVARIGSDAVAAVGLTESVITLIYAIAIGLSMAGTAMVSRRIGEKDNEGASRATVHVLLTGVLVSIPLALVGVFAPVQILQLMGASDAVVQIGSGYTAVLLGSNVVIVMLFLFNAVFRGAGDAALAMRALTLANTLNILLDPCFIFGLGPFPELGVTGAAVATTLGRGAGVLYQTASLLGDASRLHIARRHLRLHVEVMRRLIRVSLGGVAQYLLATGSWLVLVRIVAVFGSAALAGYTIALRIVIFTILPAWGLSNAAATLVGQNLGAGKPGRAEEAVWRTTAYNVAFLVLIAFVFIFYPEPVVRLITNEEAVVAHAVSCLRLMSYGYGFYAIGMVLSQAFNGAGDTMTPTLINFIAYWLLQIPMALFLSLGLKMGATGVYLAIMISESTLAVLSIMFFRRGKWKGQEV